MKLLIISDIHGNYDVLNKIINNEDFDYLVILGDLFSYDYNKSKSLMIIDLLKKYINKMILIKGNCDNTILYSNLEKYSFDIVTLPFNNKQVTFTHGHLYNKYNMPSNHGSIIITGHTHTPSLYEEKNIVYLNPGSISYPRKSIYKTYATFTENEIVIKTVDNQIINKIKIS